MAGCGALSKVLKDKEVDIIATDNFTWDGRANWNTDKNYWTDIENIDAIEAIEKYKDRDIVIMSWAYMDDVAYKSLLKMREVNPDMIMVVIGEGEGGCTADDGFFNECIEIESKDIDYINLLYPRWNAIYDHLMIVK
jgi:putative heme degradation protein